MMPEPIYGSTSTAHLQAHIRYAQSWEDPVTVIEALKVGENSDVLGIASGGDNCLAMLLAGAQSVTAVDMNPAQIALLELKARAIEHLTYEECMRFIGVLPGRDRSRRYGELRSSLSWYARKYWDHRRGDIEAGIIHAGKFERYFSLFRKRMLPLMQSTSTVYEFLRTTSLEEQKILFHERWDNRRWRAFYRLFFSRLLLGRIGRDPAFFEQVGRKDIAAELLRRTARGLTEVPVPGNFFVEYMLTGEYRDLRNAHPWMHPDRYEELRARLPRLCPAVGRLEHYRAKSAGGFTAVYCSDIFEYMHQIETYKALASLVERTADGARLMYYTLFVHRSVPDWMCEEQEAAERLFASDRTFFYGGIHMARFVHTNMYAQDIRME